MSLEDDLFRIEEGFWLAGEDHFSRHVDDRCLLAFPQAGQMHGLYSREQIAKSATVPNRWRDLKMSNRQILQPTPEVALIIYQAEALRRRPALRRFDRFRLCEQDRRLETGIPPAFAGLILPASETLHQSARPACCRRQRVGGKAEGDGDIKA